MCLKTYFHGLFIFLYFLSNSPLEVHVMPIVGGQFVNTIGDIPKYPFMVSLQDRFDAGNGTFHYQHFCGGSLIASKWILTAAHCTWRKSIDQIVAVIGQENISSLLVLRYYNIESAENIFFQPINLQNDIALLRLEDSYEEPFSTTDVHPFAKLPRIGMKASRKRPCKIIGFGATQNAGKTQTYLREGEVNVISNKRCQEILGHVWAPHTGENTICAMGEEQDTCQGDSGGPLICSYEGQDYVYGIVSHGLACGIPGVPSIYTVTLPYREWIDLVIDN